MTTPVRAPLLAVSPARWVRSVWMARTMTTRQRLSGDWATNQAKKESANGVKSGREAMTYVEHVRVSFRFHALMALITLCGCLTGCGQGGTSTRVITITVLASAGGAVEPPSARVRRGDTQRFNLTPAPRFRLSEVTGCNGQLTGVTYQTGLVVSATQRHIHRHRRLGFSTLE